MMKMKCILIMVLISSVRSCNVTIDENDSRYSEAGIDFEEITNFRIGKDNDFIYTLMPDSSVMSIGLNGKLFFKKGSDRERLCQVPELRTTCKCQDSICRVPIGIWRQKKPSTRLEPPSRWHVTLCIKDQNDNCPVLPRVILRSISESVKPGTKIALPAATDADSDSYSSTTYKLSCDADSQMFQLLQPDEKSRFPELNVSSNVDHERTVSHTCQLDACEHTCCTSASITISVTDENDHPPSWAINSWSINVKENAAPNTEIIQLFATDPDSTFNQLRFSIIDGNRQDLFMIEPKSGKIRLAGYLDYDTMSGKEIMLMVKVTDNGPYNPRSSTGTVTISVEDINDNAPVITLENNVITIEENSPVTYLGFMSVSDADSGDNKQVSCLVTDPSEKILLKPAKIESSNQIFDIYSTAPFDHEVAAMVSLKIRCHDMGRPSLSSDVTVTLRIVDVDDNTVRFSKTIFSTAVEEEKEIGTLIIQLDAIDSDSSSVIEYLLKNSSQSSAVELDMNHGILRSSMVFDREVQDEYRIDIIAREKNSPNKTDEAVVIIKVLDINDNEPKFEKVYSFLISENKEINFEIGRIEATDPDFKNNGTVIFFQQSNRDGPRSPFLVDQTGKIRLLHKLDYESQSLHHLVILASDLGVPLSRTATTTVVISVIDENDNPPYFLQKHYKTDINCNTRFINRDQFPVFDNDTETKHRQMHFIISTVTPQSVTKNIRIDKQTGEITLEFDPNQDCSILPKIMKVKIVVFDPTMSDFRDYCYLRVLLSAPVTDNRIRGKSYREKIKDVDGQHAEDFGMRKNTFEYNILIVIIFVVLTLMLVLLLTCVIVFARRCRHDGLEMDYKIDNDFPSAAMETVNRGAIIKSNNIPKTEFQVLPLQVPDNEVAISPLLWDPSEKCPFPDGVSREERHDYQLLNHSRLNYGHKYQDNYFVKIPNSQAMYQSMQPPKDKYSSLFATKTSISTTFV